MFNIVLYKTNNEVNRVNKTLYDGLQITGALRNETEVLHPVVLIEGNYEGFNYCHIPIWERYYFIRDHRSVRNNLTELNLEVDVLMSFKDEIKREQAIIDKQSSIANANMYIDDGDWIVQNNEFIQFIDFQNGFNNEGEFILIAAGGGIEDG